MLKVVKLTLRLLFQQYVEAGGGPIAVFDTEPTPLPLFTAKAKSNKPLTVRDTYNNLERISHADYSVIVRLFFPIEGDQLGERQKITLREVKQRVLRVE